MSYIAPKDLAERQRITLTALSSGNDALASAGIELSPETSPLGRWAYLILVAAAGALGGCIAGTRTLVNYIGNRMVRADWWLYFVTAQLFGAVAGLAAYFGVTAIFGPDQALLRNATRVVAIALMAGFFMDSAVAKLLQFFDVQFRGTDARERST